MQVKQAEAMIANFKKIAELHRPDLESTNNMPNYNASFTQLLKLKNLCAQQKLADVSSTINTLLTGSFAEMKEELPDLVAPKDLASAYILYEQIKQQLQANLTPSLGSTSSTSPTSYPFS